jgi:nucleotide-binding universal stress UspA family protein
MSTAPIVVGTDGSVTADRAVDKAVELAAALGAPLHVIMSYNTVTSIAALAIAGGIAADPVTADAELRSHAEGVVARAAGRLERIGVKITPGVWAGDPADALIATAADVGAQMIVVGNKGMHGPRRVLGSVPNRVSHHAACCVLIVQTC